MVAFAQAMDAESTSRSDKDGQGQPLSAFITLKVTLAFAG
jgi:hypothetical protein